MCRRCRRFDYTALRDEQSLPQKIRFEKTQQENILRDEAWMSCQFYMRSNPQYDSVQRMENIGSRFGRHWFSVKDSMNKENVLTITQLCSNIPIPFSSSTRRTLKELFSILKHPYIFPTTDIDFVIDQKLVVVVQPVASRGSLKDYIFQKRYSGCYQDKYFHKTKGLINTQVKLFGRQILEALLYLDSKGFPTHGHLTSSNVMISDGCCTVICRLAAIENSFLGYTSKLYPLIQKKISKQIDAIDSVCFGHLFYEMCTGKQLLTAHPTPVDLSECKNPDAVNVLNYIFENRSGKYPSIKEISELDFFCHEKLLELAKFNPAPISYSQPMKSLLKTVKKGRQLSKKSSLRKTTSIEKSSKDAKMYSSSKSLSKSSAQPTKAPSAPVAPPPPKAPPPPLAPPPPPAKGPPPPPAVNAPAATNERSALLGDIRHGLKLKKATTNDRSAPKV
ncbi:slowpoke-binding protein-like isoform X1 [Mytilus galloprovincialis]|uniref:slowpoke-binding protein-like isoform X1 n=1 Tax=Mytilus galloprovincialis TaxID=29158 RepID=UPI003F7C9E80